MVQTGSDTVQTDSDTVQTNSDWFRHGSGTVPTGSGMVQTRLGMVFQTRFRLVQNGLSTLQARFRLVQARFRHSSDWFRHGSDTVQAGWDMVQTGSNRFRHRSERFMTGSDTVQTGSDTVETVSDTVNTVHADSLQTQFRLVQMAWSSSPQSHQVPRRQAVLLGSHQVPSLPRETAAASTASTASTSPPESHQVPRLLRETAVATVSSSPPESHQVPRLPRETDKWVNGVNVRETETRRASSCPSREVRSAAVGGRSEEPRRHSASSNPPSIRVTMCRANRRYQRRQPHRVALNIIYHTSGVCQAFVSAPAVWHHDIRDSRINCMSMAIPHHSDLIFCWESAALPRKTARRLPSSSSTAINLSSSLSLSPLLFLSLSVNGVAAAASTASSRLDRE